MPTTSTLPRELLCRWWMAVYPSRVLATPALWDTAWITAGYPGTILAV